ncbi:MAG: trans-sulfuration enzyme family protein [Chlamydiota bacterium]
MSNDKHGFYSKAIHAGYHAQSGPVNPPVEESSTYAFKNCQDGAERFASKDKEGIYSRIGNPTVEALANKVAALENGYGGIVVGSGMAAVNTVYSHYLSYGAHVVCTASVYGPSRNLLESPLYYHKWGVEASFVDSSVADNVAQAIKPHTKLIYIETPANPTLSITDLVEVAKIAHEHQIPLVVDNTFCSPYLQRPLDLGADVVLHSMTKSIGGHSDAVGGVIVAKSEKDYYALKGLVVISGCVMCPHTASQFNKGLKTLPLRMERMEANAKIIAQYLHDNPKVAWVNYPGLEDHPSYDFVKNGKQMKGPGSMMTFGIKGGYHNATTVIDNLQLITLAVSLGSVETLVQHPASMTHAGLSKEAKESAGISDDLVRLSIGIEDPEDLIADFDQALSLIE